MTTEQDPASNATPPRARRSSNTSQALQAVANDADNSIGVDAEQIIVRPISGQAELDEVYRLTHDAYLERGYCERQSSGRLIHYPELDCLAETAIFIALQQERVIGTVSVTLDNPAGLHVDHDFKTECDAIRAEGKRLAASWRIATSSACRSERAVVMALIQAVVDAFLSHGVETAVFTFNPRHERIYQRILNMTTVARNDNVGGLSNAPAVFMRMTLATIPERWLKTAATTQENA